MASYVITTSHDHPPIPHRGFDWSAYEGDMDIHTPVGHGATEREAVENLLIHISLESEKV